MPVMRSPIVDFEFSLDDAAKAHQRMETGLNKGKILLAATV
jgi:NADPH:quinone reductase-like Zn-dependent oxidoreductase